MVCIYNESRLRLHLHPWIDVARFRPGHEIPNRIASLDKVNVLINYWYGIMDGDWSKEKTAHPWCMYQWRFLRHFLRRFLRVNP